MKRWRPFQVAAGENPTREISLTDISQGCEMTPEVGLKNEASAHAYSTISSRLSVSFASTL